MNKNTHSVKAKISSEQIWKHFNKRMNGQKFFPLMSSMSILFEGAGWNVKKFYRPYSKNNVIFDNLSFADTKNGFCLLSETKYEGLAEENFIKYWKNKDLINKQNNLLKKFYKTLEAKYSRFTYDFVEKRPESEVIKKLEEIVDISRFSYGAFSFSLFFDKNFCLRMIKKLNINISSKRLEELWLKMTEPIYDSFDRRHKFVYYRLISNNPDYKKIIEFCQYFYVGYGSVPTFIELEKNLSEEFGKISRSEALAWIKQYKNENKIRIRKNLVWLKKLRPEEQKLAEYIKFLINIRDARKDLIGMGITGIYRFADKIIKRSGLTASDLLFIIYEELISGEKYILANSEEIKKRKRGVAAITDYEGKVSLYACDCLQLARLINKKIGNSQKSKIKIKGIYVIKGQTGAPGIVRGAVRIVHNPKNVIIPKNKFILVTSMTRPEFIQLMKNSAAIVTDEGGVTCHAAIVARELKKPCVIGTKIATQVLKDGDYIEVDANNGSVKILKRA